MSFELIDKVPEYEAAIWNEEKTKILNKGGKALWSAKFAPPAVGEVVVIRINAIGNAVVEGYCLAYGFLGVMAKPLDPPEWYVKQNGGNVAGCVFGAEISIVEKDSEGNPLEPGAMYCKCTVLVDECDAVSFGSLVRYGSDGKFYNVDYCEEMEEDNSYYDFLVRQVGAIDPDYIF